MSVVSVIEVRPAEYEGEIKNLERIIERRLNNAVDQILNEIEQAQIGSYTANSNPTRPAGSTYVRTFKLQGASKKQRISKILPEISGEWSVNESKVRYGDYVLGTRAQQARIHRGRWKSKTDVEKEVTEKAPQIVEEELRNL